MCSKDNFPGVMIDELREQLGCHDYGSVSDPVFVALEEDKDINGEHSLRRCITEVRRIGNSVTLVVKRLPWE